MKYLEGLITLYAYHLVWLERHTRLLNCYKIKNTEITVKKDWTCYLMTSKVTIFKISRTLNHSWEVVTPGLDTDFLSALALIPCPLASSFFSPNFSFLGHTGYEITRFLRSLTAVKWGVQNLCTYLWQVSSEEGTPLGAPERHETEQTQTVLSRLMAYYVIKHEDTNNCD